jgi:hypothetical protein
VVYNLSEPVFSHGQLYVALSMGVSRGSTWVLCKPSKDVDAKGNRTQNPMYFGSLNEILAYLICIINVMRFEFQIQTLFFY